MPKRYPDWQSRLHDFLILRDPMPFKWHDNDCATFSADAILAMTGTDVAAEYRGRYTTQLGSLKTIRKVTGGSTVEDAIVQAAHKHGLSEISPKRAARGDWLLIENGPDRILGLVALTGRHAVAVADSGIIFAPMTSALRAWRV